MPLIAAFLLSVVLASGLTGCGPAARQPNRVAETPVAERAVLTEQHPASTSVSASDQPSTYLVLRLKQRRLEMMRNDVAAPIASFPIAIGRAGHETPTGRFQVEEMI